MTALTDLQKQLADAQRNKVAAQRQLVGARKRGKAATDAASSAMASAVTAEAAALGRLGLLGDPTTLIKQLDDSYPIVLFPLRLETRFKQVGGTYQLWIRAYPDDCQVQTYTDFITDAELTNTRQFWIGYWKAGGHVDQQRAAWRALVARHGSGRAQLLVSRIRPSGTAPTKVAPQDVVLVIASDAAPPVNRAAAEAYWIATWRAGKNAQASDAARAALVSAVGDATAAAIVETWAPANLDDLPLAPYERAAVVVWVATIALPPAGSIETTTTSWQQAPRATTLPECLVFSGYSGTDTIFSQHGAAIPSTLSVGPDPSLPEGQQIKAANGQLTLNDDLKWLGDFEEAVARGMGIKIPLSQAHYEAGFDRIVVLGVRFASDAEHGAELLEALIRDHAASKSGISLLPQGTPTNNTDDLPSGYSWQDDPDASFDRTFGVAKDFPLSNDLLAKRDGQWLAELLGIDVEVVRQLPHADGLDQATARAMNTALWPTTWGYFLESMIGSQLPAADVEHLRTFFIRYISGRGAVPAIRIAKQPYGILPAAPRASLYLDPATIPDKVPIPHPPPQVGGRMPAGPGSVRAVTPIVVADPWPLAFVNKLQDVLETVTKSLDALLDGIPRVGGNGVADQLLLDVVGLLPSSVEYYQRIAMTFAQVQNQIIAEHHPKSLQDAMMLYLSVLQQQSFQALSDLGLADPSKAPATAKVLEDSATQLTGGVVDDVPLSEVSPIRGYSADGKNYLDWLASSAFDVIRREDFGAGHTKPRALLYLLARYALLLGYWDGALQLVAKANPAAAAAARIEPDFFQLGDAVDGTSKYHYLVNPAQAVTGDAHTTLGEYLDRPQVRQGPEAAKLRALANALGVLAGASTSSLERAFAEHIDLCSYRLDAWRLGLVHHRLAQQRTRKARGSYLGAYGWIDGLRHDNKTLAPVTMPQGSHPSFTAVGRAPIMRDDTNLGYIHAPSIPQATTAAILRNAYVTHATKADPTVMSVNLTSDRVRRARAIVDGIQHGQGLAELLGYQFERGLHDAHNLTGQELEPLLLALRQAFPLVANKHTATRVDTKLVSAAAARNVIDGLALVEAARTKPTYPFGATDLPSLTQNQQKAIDAEADRLGDTNDAVGDLLLAESVYHVVHGQTERASAAADVLGKGGKPQPPDVTETPRSGLVLVHRVALHVDSSAKPAPGASPLALAEPAIEAWLASRLPAPAKVAVAVHCSDPIHGERDVIVTQADLGLGAADLLRLLVLDGGPAFAELDDRIAHHVRSPAAHPGLAIAINYTTPVPGSATMFELASLIRHLRTLILQSRPLAATDLVRAADVGGDGPRWDVGELGARVAAAVAGLAALVAPYQALEVDASSPAEAYLDAAESALANASRYGVPHTGSGAFRSDVRGLYLSVMAKLDAVITRWNENRTGFTAALAGLPALPSDTARLAALARAEDLISNVPLDPRPPTVVDYQAALSSKLAAFDVALAALVAPRTADVTTVDALFTTIESAIANLATFDPIWYDRDRRANDLAPERAGLALLRNDVVARIAAVRGDLQKRVAAAQALIAKAQSTTDVSAAVAALEQASQQVLGSEAKLLPRFTLATDPGNDLESAVAASAAILTDLISAGRDFPVDDWLYSVARVRPKLASWEAATMLAEAFGAPAGELVAVQLPYTANDRWAALELPPTYALDDEKLLYTSSFAAAFDPTHPQAGLVLDEWTEVVPGVEETTGIAFHFDQPNNEPPQAILIASPAHFRGGWVWDELVACVTDTFHEAKRRAFEPDTIAQTSYGQFLPATLLVVTATLITISTNLRDNNG